MRGYAEAHSRTIFRDLIDMPATVTVTDNRVNVHFHRRAHLPIVADSPLFKVPVNIPWWNGLTLTMSA